MEEWKEKGYHIANDIDKLKSEKKPEHGSSLPGMPVTEGGIDPSKVIYTIKTKWRRMLWKDQNAIFSKCLKTQQRPDGTSRVELDTITYRDLKLKTCLKEWDFKDEKNRDVPVSIESIDSLMPEIATELINAFERYTEPSSEDLGE
jgi:hypothetical protein